MLSSSMGVSLLVRVSTSSWILALLNTEHKKKQNSKKIIYSKEFLSKNDDNYNLKGQRLVYFVKGMAVSVLWPRVSL